MAETVADVTIQWAPVPRAVGYRLYRTDPPPAPPLPAVCGRHWTSRGSSGSRRVYDHCCYRVAGHRGWCVCRCGRKGHRKAARPCRG